MEFLKKPMYIGALLVILAAVSFLSASWYDSRTPSNAVRVSEDRILDYTNSMNPEFVLNTAGLKSEGQGLTYYFCSDTGRQKFDQTPERFVAKPATTSAQKQVMSPPKDLVAPEKSPEKTKDPVCGHEVDEDQAKAAGLTSDYEGKTYYFCSYSCNKQFDQNPERYLAKTPAGSGHGVASPLTTAPAAAPTAMSKDPICNLEVDEAKATAAGLVSEYRGKTYFFDSKRCKQKFDKQPARYAVKAVGVQKTSAFPAGSTTRGVTLGMLQDPVCGSPVIEDTARDFGLVSQYQEKTYFFDSIQCKQYFDKQPRDYVDKGAGTQKKPGVPASGDKTLPPGLAKDPVSGLNVDQRMAKAVGLVSEYQGKTYFFFNIHFKNNFDADPARYVPKTSGTQKGAVSPAGSQEPVTPPGATPATPPGPAVVTPHSPAPVAPPETAPVQPQPQSPPAALTPPASSPGHGGPPQD